MAKKKENDAENEAGTGKKKGKLFKILILLLAMLIVGGGGYTGAAYFLNLPPFEVEEVSVEDLAAQHAQQEAEEVERRKEIFVSFDAPFSFSLKTDSKMHNGQIEVVLVTVGDENAELCRKHLPLINSEIFNVLSSQEYAEMLLPSGRQHLKAIILETVRSKLTEVTKKPAVDQVLFTRFLVQ